MGEVWGRWGGVVLAASGSLPVAALAAWALARWRLARGAGSPWRASVAEVGMVVGTLPWVWMILTPDGAPRRVDLVPLRSLAADLTDPVTATVQIGGNLLVFAAFGALAPVRWRIGLRTVVACAAAASVLVEALQYALDLGRVSDLDDVLVNAAGAGLAALCTRRWWRLRERLRGRPRGRVRDADDPEDGR
jgi:hypothetical protein